VETISNVGWQKSPVKENNICILKEFPRCLAINQYTYDTESEQSTSSQLCAMEIPKHTKVPVTKNSNDIYVVGKYMYKGKIRTGGAKSSVVGKPGLVRQTTPCCSQMSWMSEALHTPGVAKDNNRS
jgi:hypothetical protein